MIAAALLSAPPASSSSLSKSSSATMTMTTAMLKTTEQQVRTLIPVTTSDGSKLYVSGPCIVLKTQTPTVAQQMQALRPLLKSDNNNKNVSNTTVDTKNIINNNDDNNNNNNSEAFLTDDNNSATSPGSNTENEPEALRVKRRIDFTALGLPRPQPQAMARRNERERNRVKQVNQGFETLRQHVPQGRKNKKLSKVDTLKEAAKYIKYLHQLLVEADQDSDSSLTSAISDTITIVSRPTTSTTTTTTTSASVATSPAPPSPSQDSPTTSETSSASTNTTAITAADLLQLATPMECSGTTADFAADHTPNVVSDSLDFADDHTTNVVSDSLDFADDHTTNVVSHSLDFADEHSTNVVSHSLDFAPNNGSPVFGMDNGCVTFNSQVDYGHTAAQLANVQDFMNVSPMGSTSTDMGEKSPTHLLELAPAQLHYGNQQQSPHPSPAIPAPMEVDHVQIAIDNSAHFLRAPFNTHQQHPQAMHFLDLNHSTSSSPDCSPVEPPRHLALQQLAGFQSLKTDMSCGGSEGSCPVSPSESSGTSEASQEEGLGMCGGENWQDLSADIAEWLCSKIDIEDPEVFV
ncbi:uncharacterized protein [Littorina saxatilis]|uniref:BHLH domain-containing protein n=1 Tax=Littorina saxatilis TaxID=31220 RepID=A0AAN9BLU9_9CAEN